MRYRYQQPGNEDEFEDFCVRFYRHFLKRATLVRYGKRGEKQDGIDIIDQVPRKPHVAIQCKYHEITKTITPKSIKHEVLLAETSVHKVDHYIIATTAKKSRYAQDTVIKLNQRPANIRRFTVEIHFWEEICTHLSEFGQALADFIFYPELSQGEVGGLCLMPAGSPSYSSAPTLGSPERSVYSEIDALFMSRKIEVVEYEISKFPDPEVDDSLTPADRYAILRFRAKLAMERSQFDKAARLFMLAYEASPELQQAQQNRILALSLTGNQRQVVDEAANLLNSGIRSPFLVTLLVRGTTEPEELVPFQNLVDEYLSNDEELMRTLVDKYLGWQLPDRAIAVTAKLREHAPKSAHALFTCGMVSHYLGLNGDWKNRAENLYSAIGYYTDAFAAAERDKYPGLIPEICTNRGRVFGALRNYDAAKADYRRAVSGSDNLGLYADPAITFFLHIEDFDSARALLPSLSPNSDDGKFLTVATNYHFATNDEKRNLIVKMAGLGESAFERATEAIFHSVQWAIDLRDLDLARDCVSTAFLKRCPFQGNTLFGWIELEAENVELAREYVEKALDSSSRLANQQEIVVLATLLVKLHDEERALPLLEQAATPGVFDDACMKLVSCAQRLGRHDTLLRTCEELRQTGQQDEKLRKMEVQMLSHYDPEKALSLAIEFKRYDKIYFTAATNFIATHLGRKEVIDFEGLPPEAFSPDDGYLVVTPLVEARRFQEAMTFAYHQLRNNFSAERAHGQYIWFFLKYGKKTVFEATEAAGTQSAILIENTTTKEQRWITVEDANPDIGRYELASSSDLVQAIIGKRIGEFINVTGQTLRVQEERIVAIQSKFLRLFQDAIRNFQYRFPGGSTVQWILVGSGDEFDPTPLINQLEQGRKELESVSDYYHNNFCSLHFFASMIGCDLRQLMQSLVQNDHWFVRCADCSPVEFNNASTAKMPSKKFVLDISAIVTISMLEIWEHLDKTAEYFVSRHALDTIEDWLRKLLESEGQPVQRFGVGENGQMLTFEITSQQLRQEINEVQGIISELRARCKIKTSLAVAALDPKRRDGYRDVLGNESLHALSVAKEENAILWTDDIFVAIVAEVDFGVQRIWTQLAFKRLEKSGGDVSKAVIAVTAKLAAWNYNITFWEPQDFIVAAEIAKWDVNDWPLHQFIRLIRSSVLSLDEKKQFGIAIMQLLRRSSCNEFMQTSVVQAILDAIENIDAVTWMLSKIDGFFRIDFPSASFLKYELNYWLRFR